MDRVRNLLEQIRNRLEELNKAERKVAEVILLNPQQATRFSIAALAQAASVSEPTVNRFCRSFGVSGYPELKLQLAQSLASGAAYVSRAVESIQPIEQGVGFARMQQAVATDVHVVIGRDLDACQVFIGQSAFSANTGNKRAFGAGLRQRYAQPGVFVRVNRLDELDAFVTHGQTCNVTELTTTVTAQVDGFKAVAPGGGHDIEAATGMEAGTAGQRITAGAGQGVEGHDQIDDDLACVQQSRHWQTPCWQGDGLWHRPAVHTNHLPPQT